MLCIEYKATNEIKVIILFKKKNYGKILDNYLAKNSRNLYSYLLSVFFIFILQFNILF